uniref:(California timema) hypothetical protein n=1 Tax=Timema californicum TaxID=61474 RepID=A0A7R9P573_TIMCA|nr:unnamed protein product [Timema californicum]
MKCSQASEQTQQLHELQFPPQLMSEGGARICKTHIEMFVITLLLEVKFPVEIFDVKASRKCNLMFPPPYWGHMLEAGAFRPAPGVQNSGPSPNALSLQKLTTRSASWSCLRTVGINGPGEFSEHKCGYDENVHFFYHESLPVNPSYQLR